MATTTPIWKRRKPGLGHYSGTRAEWRAAWSLARSKIRAGEQPDPKTSGLVWKASLIAAFERHEYTDPLSMPIHSRLEAHRLVNDILAHP